MVACSKDNFLNFFSVEGSSSNSLAKQDSFKSSALTIVYEIHGNHILGFNGLFCIYWDTEQDLALLKVNTKGGNRPVRAWYGPLEPEGAARAMIVFTYGDCLALAFKSGDSDSADLSAKVDLMPSLHGREILSALSLSGGRVLLTGSEDTTFKVLRVQQQDGSPNRDQQLHTLQTFGQHEASVRTFAKCKVPNHLQANEEFALIGQSHLVLSAGSKM